METRGTPLPFFMGGRGAANFGTQPMGSTESGCRAAARGRRPELQESCGLAARAVAMLGVRFQGGGPVVFIFPEGCIQPKGGCLGPPVVPLYSFLVGRVPLLK